MKRAFAGGAVIAQVILPAVLDLVLTACVFGAGYWAAKQPDRA